MAGLVPGCDVGEAPLTSGGTHSLSVSAALESGADLVVTEVSAPANVMPGQGFPATVKVCNQGTLAVDGDSYSGPRVELFVVTDATAPIPPGEMPLGSVVLDQTLFPSQCVTKSLWGHAHPPFDAQQGDGAYPLVAIVDRAGVVQELREDNNVRVSGMLGVGSGSDLVVTGVSAPANVMPGQGFPARVTVCNRGTYASGGYASPRPRVELFLSTLPELTPPSASTPYPGTSPSQVSIGWVELEGLAVGQCVTKNVYGQAMLPPEAQGEGTYYLGAVVDTTNEEQELREDNNVHVEGRVGVGDGSDLVVTEVKGPENVGNGQSFTASVKVCNLGTASTGSGSYNWPRVELYLSTDTGLTILDPSSLDLPMDQVSLGWVYLDQNLSPGQCVTKNMDAESSVPPAAGGMDGAYYLGAAVDTSNVEQELREDNNVRVGSLMGVGYRADLVVTEVGFPASVPRRQGFTASVKVCNLGLAASGNASSRPWVLLFLSMDDEVTVPDPSSPSPGMPMEQEAIGWVELSQSLAPGQCETVSVPASAETPPMADAPNGAYYLAAAVDVMNVEQELREDNNLRVGGLMGVGDGADLVVTDVSGPASASNGQNFTASVTVCNQGTMPAGLASSFELTQVLLYFSSEATFTMPEQSMPGPAGPMPIGGVYLDQPLYPGQCVTKSVDAQAWLPMWPQTNTRAYHLVAAVDTNRVEPELREDNNVRVGGLMGVGNGADLVVSAVTAPASVGMGQGFTVSVTVCNQGTLSTDTFSSPLVQLFLSMDTEVTLPTPDQPYPHSMDQMLIGSVELNQPLPAGQCVTEDVNAHAGRPPEMQGPGALYLAAAVDTMNAEQELREDNNLRADTLLQLTY
ncbi:hypothetical protein BO221_26420 [Archangium sp. Cb G35]|uniref:CARDB domain-containing protein n=1 Tax=Archangium sp. Cb G35 TaxID=1920190 RepID=UPI0009599E30|nr:CARDB domain-containing protein [Archangium sp. Cb G35]OJT21361.1 hypothetical protein BO221_26420 [Archangium sp. Cb G35]